MYASLTSDHHEMREDARCQPYMGRVSCHLSNNLYLSLTGEEATRLADMLIRAAIELETEQEEKEAG